MNKIYNQNDMTRGWTRVGFELVVASPGNSPDQKAVTDSFVRQLLMALKLPRSK